MGQSSDDDEAYPYLLKKLQDLCYRTKTLPSCYWLRNVEIDYGDPIGQGGEMKLYAGKMKGLEIVARRSLNGPDFWNTEEGYKSSDVGVTVTGDGWYSLAKCYLSHHSSSNARSSRIHSSFIRTLFA